jgi:hypothetical protein
LEYLLTNVKKLGFWLRLELAEAATGLIQELDAWFSKQTILDAMEIIYPQY